MTVLTGPISSSSDSEAWLNALRSSGPARDQAVASLYGLLLGGARCEVGRRRASVGYVRGEDCDDIAMQAADDALVAVLAKLNEFRGESRFTTWAYKFALLEAGVRVRRRAWQQREVVLDSDSWRQLAEAAPGPDVSAERVELFGALTDCIGDDLTAHQRRVLVAITLDGVPVDVLAERLNTTRGALYKTLHDARRKLRILLADRGLPVEAS
jgi:RNA polymerase sigma-70 factor (ECF subfamily)